MGIRVIKRIKETITTKLMRGEGDEIGDKMKNEIEGELED